MGLPFGGRVKWAVLEFENLDLALLRGGVEGYGREAPEKGFEGAG